MLKLAARRGSVSADGQPICWCMTNAIRDADTLWNDPDARELWQAAGVTDADEAAKWVACGIADPGEVRAWKENKFDNPLEAQLWKDVVYTPQQAFEWLLASFGLDEARLWLRACIYSPFNAADWRCEDIDPQAAYFWLLAGCDAASAGAWDDSGVLPMDAREWITRSIDEPRDAQAWLHNLGDQEAAFHWLDRDFDLSTASEWHAENFDPAEARGWLDRRVDSAKDAARYRDRGFTPDNPPLLGRKAAHEAQRKK